MFRLLATTKCMRQQIAILIISFFAYVSGIRNEGNNMLLQQQQQQQQELVQQQQTTIENSNNKSPLTDIKQQTTFKFRPSQVIDFTPADAAMPQQFKPTYTEGQHSTKSNVATRYNNNKSNNFNNNNNFPQKQESPTVNRRYTIQAAATHANIAEKQFKFPNEQQQIPQHLTDKPIYIYRDPFTNENYHYTPTEPNVKDTRTTATTYNHNNYNNNAYNQQNSHDDNQEYLVQSSMIVGTHQQHHQQQGTNPFRPYMSLSADKDVYLKRPGLVYDDKLGYKHPNSVIDKKSEEMQTMKVNKISYDSHDYPPPSYFQQQTSNFLPTPVPAQPSTPRPAIRPTTPSTPPYKQVFRPTQPTIFAQQSHQQPYLQSSQSTLPNYANNIDNYLLNKQTTSDYYRIEAPAATFGQHQHQQPQMQHQYENRPPSSFQYDSIPPPHHQHYSRPPYNAQYEASGPPPGRPSYNNYYDYQIGEIPPQHTSLPPSQHSNYPRPPPEYPYQGPHRPPSAAQQQQQSGLATLAQYAPQFTSLLLGGVGNGGAASNTNGPLGSLIGALTGSATSQQPSSSSYNRRPVNSQLIKALENIAHNDDLQCVPKVLCQMIAAQTQRGQLPTFISSPAIANFLAGFPAASPALIYGRAALLGLSGGDKSCHQTYVKCPKDEYEIIYYLNNHRGGFFKFFSEPEEQKPTTNHDSTQQGATSLFSILSALAGSPDTTTTTPRPKPKPPADVTGGITNFFTHLLSDYMGGASVEYQRRNKRAKRSVVRIKFEDENEESPNDNVKFQIESNESYSDEFKFKGEHFDADSEEDFHDEEDEEDTQTGFSFHSDDGQDYLDSTEKKLYINSLRKNRYKFFPETGKEIADGINTDEELQKMIKKYNEFNKARKLKFPTEDDERADLLQQKLRDCKDALAQHKQNYGPQFHNYVESPYEDFQKETRKIQYMDNEGQPQSLYSNYLKSPTNQKNRFVFPERGGKILNHPYYAASHLQDYLQQAQFERETESAQDEKFIVPNVQSTQHYTGFPSTSQDFLQPHGISFNDPSSFSTNSAVNNNIYVSSSSANINGDSNYFLPTPSPPEKDYTSSNSIYSTSDYSSNQHSHNPPKQKYSSASPSKPIPSFNGDRNKFYKPKPYTFASNSNINRYHSSLYTTGRPYTSVSTTRKSNDQNIYVTNSRGVTEYYIKPDGRKVYL